MFWKINLSKFRSKFYIVVRLDQTHGKDDIEHLKHGQLPDPVINLIKSLETRLSALEEKLPKK